MMSEVWADAEKQIRQRVRSAGMARVAKLNEKYEANNYHGVKGKGRNYQVIRGKVPVLLSAPHAVKQVREGVIKNRDGMTGGIVEYLCEELGIFGVTRLWEAGDDPNYARDERSEAYREEIVRLVRENDIKWVFDIHGCLDKYGFAIDVGINGGQNVACGAAEIRRLVGECWGDLDVRVDERFVAGRLESVANVVHRETGANCLQLELSEKVRTTDKGFERFERGLRKWVETVSLLSPTFMNQVVLSGPNPAGRGPDPHQP